MGLPMAELEARKERSGLQPKHLDPTVLTGQTSIAGSIPEEPFNYLRQPIGIDFCFSLFNL